MKFINIISGVAACSLPTVEVGGAYAHHFYKFLDFLELKSLFITDIDAVERAQGENRITYPGCEVARGTHSSNSGIKNWFTPEAEGYIALDLIRSKTKIEKVTDNRRIAYQIPEAGKTCCGRSFEDAFMLANLELFGLAGDSEEALATMAYEKADDKIVKTDFAIEYAIDKTEWVTPLYISQGLAWLAQNQVQIVEAVAPVAI